MGLRKKLGTAFFAAGLTISPLSNALINGCTEYIQKLIQTIANDANSSIQIYNSQHKELLSKPEEVKKELEERLANLQHSRRLDDEGKKYTEDASQLSKLNRVDLAKIYILLKSLENQQFCNTIGSYIEDDLADIYSEHGGVVNLENGTLRFIIVPSNIEETIKMLQSAYPNVEVPTIIKEIVSSQFNGTYSPSKAIVPQNFFHFHLHAVTPDGKTREWKKPDSFYAGPSIPDRRFVQHIGIDGLVITNLANKRFNIDFFSPNGAVIDLGNYSYE